MIGQFEIATREAGVNGDMNFSRSDVFIKDADVAPFDAEAAFCDLIDISRLVDMARNGASLAEGEEVIDQIGGLLRYGYHFFPPAMQVALKITDMNSAALAVYMDDPIDLWVAMDRYCRDNIQLKPEVTFQPKEGINFIGGAGNKWDCLAPLAIEMGLKQAFAVKWKRMVARPQEIAARVLADPTGENALMAKALSVFTDTKEVIDDPRAFTVYPEGCPSHPSYVAGHGTFAGVVYALIHIKYGLDKREPVNEVIAQTLLSFAHCRSIAGVHYFQDNSMGVALGIETVRAGLPALAEANGVASEFVDQISDACEKLNSDWV